LNVEQEWNSIYVEAELKLSYERRTLEKFILRALLDTKIDEHSSEEYKLQVQVDG
jgi:hypothetical protein